MNRQIFLLVRLQLQAGRPYQHTATQTLWCHSSLVPSAAGASTAEEQMEDNADTLTKIQVQVIFDKSYFPGTSLMEIFLSMFWTSTRRLCRVCSRCSLESLRKTDDNLSVQPTAPSCTPILSLFSDAVQLAEQGPGVGQILVEAL